MRVIAGKAKGRKLRSVPGPGTRPITDRAKSALFSILGESVQEATFLDLFAGTGQVGIEALSRGAARAVFVEQGEAALRTIHQNLSLTELQTGAEVRKADVFQYLDGQRRAPLTLSTSRRRNTAACGNKRCRGWIGRWSGWQKTGGSSCRFIPWSSRSCR